MSVTMGRFVSVLSGRRVVTDKLVAARALKVEAVLSLMAKDIARLEAAGFLPGELGETYAALARRHDQGMAAGGNAAKLAIFDTLLPDARAAAAQVKREVELALTKQALWQIAVDDALRAANLAVAEVAKLPPGPCRDALDRQLAELQNRRVAASTGLTADQIDAATDDLPDISNAAGQLAAEARRLAGLLADQQAHLQVIDPALVGLRLAGTEVKDAPLKKQAAKLAKDLTARRDALANAGPAELAAQIGGAKTLADDIAAAAKHVALLAKWGKCFIERTLFQSAAQTFIAAGTKAGLPDLVDDAKQVLAELARLSLLAAKNPQAALAGYDALQTAFYQVRVAYEDAILAPRIMPKVEELIRTNPSGPEAQMQQALTPEEFTRRTLEVYTTTEALGADISMLSPGEALAINTYTTNDYQQMNGLLIGYYKPKSAAEKRSIEIKNEQAALALAKLPDYPSGIPTRRGETAWPGAEAQYTLGNVFAVKAFWSTGVGFNFPGVYQITIHGKTGKDVGAMSHYVNEAEVLFPPGTRFKVIRRRDERDSGGALVKAFVEVEEL